MKTNSKKQSSAIVGMSHLGLVVTAGLALIKPPVIGIDTDKKLIKELIKGKLPLFEPGLEETLNKVNDNINFTSDFSCLKKIKFVFFSQDTATNGTGSVKKLDQLLNQAIPFFIDGVTIVCMSQVPIGYYRKLKENIEALRPDLKFNLYHMVDTIIMTNAINRFINPERIIIGSANSNLAFSKSLKNFLKLFSCSVFHMSYESAEITKAAINLYLANTVNFANTIADFCEVSGADINDIIPALQTDKRIGSYAYLHPTLRIAGGHLERDLFMFKRFAKKKSISSGIVESIIRQNNKRYLWAINKFNQHFKNIKQPTICIWGLAYKKNSDSTMNAASILLIKNLSKKARIHTYDPMAILPKNLNGYKRFNDKISALRNADCLLVLTDWEEFGKIDPMVLTKMRKNLVIIDSMGILNNVKDKLNNLTYITMGVGNLG